MNGELDFVPDTPAPLPVLTQMEARAFRPGRAIAERELVSACLCDGSGDAIRKCAGLPRELFTDKEARSAWSVISRGVNGYSMAQVAEKSFLTTRQLKVIELLDPEGVNLHANLSTLRTAFRQSELTAVGIKDPGSADIPSIRAKLDEVERAEGIRAEKLEAQMLARAYDPSVTLEKPTPIFLLKDTTICTPGNLTTLLSQAKAGKSAIVGAMIAAAHSNPTSGHDTLRIAGPNYGKKALLHFDTEQSPYDWHGVIRSAMRRVGRMDPEPWFMSYTLTGLDAIQSRALVFHAMAHAYALHGGIHAVIIDGTADLVVDPNSPEECFPLVTKLQGAAIEYQASIINIVHMNPGSDAKARGHLGSQLERKSESNLMLEKNERGVTSTWGTKQRGKMIMRSDAPSFCWSDEAGMHVTCEPDAPGEKRRGGKERKHTFAKLLPFIPKGEVNCKGVGVIAREADQAKIPRASVYELLDEAHDDGFAFRRVDTGGVLKYWV